MLVLIIVCSTLKKIYMIYRLDLLNEIDLKKILRFSVGIFTDSKKDNLKNNLMLSDDHGNGLINRYVAQIINSREEISSILSIKMISQIYYLQYKKAMYYDYHIDNNPIGGINAHYSVTCFLDDPDTYEGGELIVKIGDVETSFKEKAGTCVIYPSGYWHKVNPVSKGTRNVLVWWMESDISNSFIRNHVVEYGFSIKNMIESVKNNQIPDAALNLQKLENFRINLMREYGV